MSLRRIGVLLALAGAMLACLGAGTYHSGQYARYGGPGYPSPGGAGSDTHFVLMTTHATAGSVMAWPSWAAGHPYRYHTSDFTLHITTEENMKIAYVKVGDGDDFFYLPVDSTSATAMVIDIDGANEPFADNQVITTLLSFEIDSLPGFIGSEVLSAELVIWSSYTQDSGLDTLKAVLANHNCLNWNDAITNYHATNKYKWYFPDVDSVEWGQGDIDTWTWLGNITSLPDSSIPYVMGGQWPASNTPIPAFDLADAYQGIADGDSNFGIWFLGGSASATADTTYRTYQFRPHDYATTGQRPMFAIKYVR